MTFAKLGKGTLNVGEKPSNQTCLSPPPPPPLTTPIDTVVHVLVRLAPLMPARTLDADTATLSPLRYAAHSPSWGRFDAGDDVGASDTPVRAPLHLQRGPSYPVSPPMQRTDHGAWQPYSFGPHNMPHTPLAPGWLPHPPGMRVVPMVPPPPLLHKVWILDCKTCGNFLTNRGMKVCALPPRLYACKFKLSCHRLYSFFAQMSPYTRRTRCPSTAPRTPQQSRQARPPPAPVRHRSRVPRIQRPPGPVNASRKRSGVMDAARASDT